MPSLPTVGGSNNTWGQELNDWLGKGGRVFDVKAGYGAAGDGVADDTAEIAAAIAAANAVGLDGENDAGSGIVYLPPGTYNVAGSGSTDIFNLTGMNKIQIIGAGMQVTHIKRTAGTGDVFSVTGTAPSTDGWMRFEGFTVNGNSTGGRGFDIVYGAAFTEWDRVEVRNCTDGWRLQSCYESSFDRCVAQENTLWGFNLHRQNDSSQLTGCYASVNDVGGYRFADGWQGPWVGCWANDNPIGVLVEHSADAGVTTGHAFTQGAQFLGGVIEGGLTQTSGFRTDSAVATNIKNLSIHGLMLTNGTGTHLNLNDLDGGIIDVITVPDGTSLGTHMALSATVSNLLISHAYTVAGAETVFSNSGTNNVRRTKNGFSKVTTYANLDVMLAEGDASPQIAFARDGGGQPALSFGAGGGSAPDCGMNRVSAGRLTFSAANGILIPAVDLEIDGALNHDGTTVGFYGKAPVTQRPANADTSGATLANVEIEVNQIKQLLRDVGLLAT